MSMVLSFRYLTHAYAMREGEMACEIEALAPKKCATWTGWLFNQCFNEHEVGHLADCRPILVMDVFEHAFITNYGLKRADYIVAFFKNIDWGVVEGPLK